MLLSVIIPTHNRSNAVLDLLDSLNQQEAVDFSWEVLVINNASTDNTEKLVTKKSKELKITIRHFIEPKIGLHHGRHRGAKEAKGKYIAYLDDDMLLSPYWIKGIDLLRKNKAQAVVGKILPHWEEQPPEWLLKTINYYHGTYGYLGLLDLGNKITEIDPMNVFGGNLFISKKLVFSLGGFNPDGVPIDKIKYRGDGENAFMFKFKSIGLKSFYDPIATAYHVIPKNRTNMEYLCKRSYNQGISDSFTKIRQLYSIQPKANNKHKINNINYFKLINFATNIFTNLIKKTSFKLINKKNTEIPIFLNQLNKYLEKSYLEGYNFHQIEVQRDPKLLKWVLRKQYINTPYD